MNRFLFPAAALFTLLGVSIAIGARPAAACTPISAVPFTISTPGDYCLAGNVVTTATSGEAITVAAGSVTIDLQGYEIAGTGSPSSTAAGIRSWAQSDVTVRNGTIRGFMYGVVLDGPSGGASSRNAVVEGLRIVNATYTGIRVTSQNASVSRNQVIQTGGTTMQGSSPTFAGIVVFGSRIVVEKNEIAGFAAISGTSSVGILTNPGTNVLLERNRIFDARTGIYVGSSAAVQVIGNQIWQGTTGVYYTLSSGKYRDNLTVGVTTPYSGGTDAGNND